MEATLFNVSPLSRTHWATLTVPNHLADQLGLEATFLTEGEGIRYRAVRGRRTNSATTYRVRVRIRGGEMLRGVLLEGAHSDAYQEHRAHRWTADNVGDLIPTVYARAEKIDRPFGGDSLLLVGESPAHRRWRVDRFLPEWGLRFVWWADILHDDPVVPVWGKIVWSDRNDPSWARTFGGFAIDTGEVVAFDFAKAHGMPAPARLGVERKVWRQILNDREVWFHDGVALPLSGAMLTYKSEDVPLPGKPVDPGNLAEQKDRNDLIAGAYGPVLGVAHGWEGHFLANRNLPRLDVVDVDGVGYGLGAYAELEWQRHVERTRHTVGMFADRPAGCSRRPWQTGDQEDFGATKGTLATVGHHPGAVRMLQYSVQAELFRGVQHYEKSGLPLSMHRHPMWTTWSGYTHWHKGVSPDRLGKSDEWVEIPDDSRWQGYDDQHRSQNNLAAYLALTDDPLMQDHVELQTTTDLAAFHVINSDTTGAARAQGRTLGTLAQLHTVTRGRVGEAIMQAIAARLQGSASNPTLKVDGPMKVLAWGRPDGRKQVYDADGNLGPWVSMWEHGLAAVGLYQLYKILPTDELADLLRTVCETLGHFGCFMRGAHFYTVSIVLWNEGQDLPSSFAEDGRDYVASQWPTGVLGWTQVGLMVAREVLGEEHPLFPKLNGYVVQTAGKRSANVRQAEWWAAVSE